MHFTLAQGLASQLPSIPRLPDPPTWEYHLFESPWVSAGVLLVLGIGGWWILRRQNQPRLALAAGLSGLLLALANVLTAHLVVTTRETLRLETTRLIDAATRADLSTLAPMLEERAGLWVFAQVRANSRLDLLSLVKRYPGQEFPVKERTIGAVQASIDAANAARTQVRVWVLVQGSYYNAPIGSWWRIDWRKSAKPAGGGGGVGAGEAEGWKVSGMTLLQLDGVSSPGQIQP